MAHARVGAGNEVVGSYRYALHMSAVHLHDIRRMVRRVGLGLGGVAIDAATGPEPAERTALEPAVRLGLHELQEGVIDEREGAPGKR